MNANQRKAQTLTLKRIIEAPRERVYAAWIDAEIMRQWCAPHGFTITHGEGDIRPGGTWRCCIHSPDGVDLWLGGTYREIVPPERLVFTHAWDREDGKPGQETRVTVSFADLNGKTSLAFH